MSEPVSSVQQYPPGWYPDPATPGRDRWWDGTASTRFTAKTVDPAKAGFGIPYVHSMRVGANRILIASRVGVIVGTVLWFFALFAAIPFTLGRGVLIELVLLVSIGILGCLTAVVTGAIGLQRAPRLGGKGVAIWAILTGSVFTLFSFFPPLMALLANS